MSSDPVTRKAFEHFYNMEYEAAIRLFEEAAAERPNDPYALNHLASAILFQELYRIGALDTEVYAKNDFLDAKNLPPDPKARVRLKELHDQVTAICDAALKVNPNDVQALYARGSARGLRSTYVGMVEKSWFGALRSTMGARHDHERVLELDPKFADAKMIVGVHNYLIGSVSWAVKVAASVIGLTGNKEKGIKYLYEAANAGGETSVDAKFSLSLFLRREERYPEAIKLVGELSHQFPRNFLLALEHANLLNAAGKGPEAITTYQKLLESARHGAFISPRLEHAHWGLGEALRGQRRFFDAANAYEAVSATKGLDTEMRQRAALAAGEMYDMLMKRDIAVQRYNSVIAEDAASPRAARARKYLKRPYRGDS